MAKPRKINVEPLLFLMWFGFGLGDTVQTAFITFKWCLLLLDSSVQVSPNAHDYCMQLGSTSNDTRDDRDVAYLNKVQAATAQYMIIDHIIATVPNVLMAVFIGAWSDLNSRKPPIIIALAGAAVSTQISVAVAAVDSIPVYVMLGVSFLKGFTGQMLVVLGGIYAMISDAASEPTQVTVRIAIASVASSFGSLSAHLISAFILQRWDDYAVIMLCHASVSVLAFLYAVFGLQETIQFSREREKNELISSIDNAEITKSISSSTSKQDSCKSFFNLRRIKESFQILTRSRPGKRRCYLLTTLLSFLILFSTQASSILNLFAKRPPLEFTNSQYSLLTSVSSAVMFVPAIIIWLVKPNDMCLIVSGLAFETIKMALTAFSTEPWMLFTAVGIGGVYGLSFTGYRSLLTKLVDPRETGRLFAAAGTIDHLTPMFSSAIFNNLYAMTLTWFPGFVFLISAAFSLLVLLIMSYLYVDMKRRNENFSDKYPPAINNGCSDQESLISPEITG